MNYLLQHSGLLTADTSDRSYHVTEIEGLSLLPEKTVSGKCGELIQSSSPVHFIAVLELVALVFVEILTFCL